MAVKEERIKWQSSLGNEGVIGIIDPITVARGGAGEPAENRPGRPMPIGNRLGNPVAKEPAAEETPLQYPEPRANKAVNRATRLEAKVTLLASLQQLLTRAPTKLIDCLIIVPIILGQAAAADYGNERSQKLLAPARTVGFNTPASFSTPAFNGVSITASSFPAQSQQAQTSALNLADPTRSHKPQGAHKEGTKVPLPYSAPPQVKLRIAAELTTNTVQVVHAVAVPAGGNINYMML